MLFLLQVLWELTLPLLTDSGVTRRGQGGTSAPGRSTLGAPYWGRNIRTKTKC